MQTGSVEVILGSMYSGKSTELMRRVRMAEFAKRRVIVFKPTLDNRFSTEKVVSHDGIFRAAEPATSPRKILFDVKKYAPDVVAIDEAQFFSEELSDVVDILAKMGKRVIVAGLDTDFMGNLWPTMTRIAFRADKLEKLNAVCIQCGNSACRNQRLVGGAVVTQGAIVEIGGTESYEARCRSCFEEESGTLEVDSNELPPGGRILRVLTSIFKYITNPLEGR